MTSIILNAAKAAKVSGALLVAICSHESGNFKQNYAAMDNGSPSFGSCQIKRKTAEFLGFKGSSKSLMDPKINAFYAAHYLAFQQRRYGQDWVKLTSAYNAGRFNESAKVVGCPRNLRYLRLVQKKLPKQYQTRLDCGYIARNQ